MTDPHLTWIRFLLDRSGSMQSIKTDTKGGFSAFIDDQRATAGTCLVTFGAVRQRVRGPGMAAAGLQSPPRMPMVVACRRLHHRTDASRSVRNARWAALSVSSSARWYASAASGVRPSRMRRSAFTAGRYW